MIKKIIACLTICFIITGIISPVFSDASALPQPNWSDPGISEIINISDLTGWMLNGGTFDVSTYTDAESFMNDYYNSRTQTRLVSPSDNPQDDYYEVLPGFGINNQLVAGESFARPLETNRVIASSFRDHTGYGRRLSNEVNQALLSNGSLYDTKIPLLNEVEFANFVNYNHDALRLYSEFFQNDDSSSDPNPDPNFSFITNINHLFQSNIDWINSDNVVYSLWSGCYFPVPRNSVTLVSDDFVTPQAHISNSGSSPNNVYYIYPTNNIVTISLFKQSDDSYNAIYSSYDLSTNANSYFIQNPNVGSQSVPLMCYYSNNHVYLRSYSRPTFDKPVRSSFPDISTAINYIYQHYCNINLYVDNVLWVLSDDPIITPTITPEFPDAVGGEDLPSTTWPISRPRAPYYTNVPGVLQAIEDAIADDGKLDIDDLKPYLTDENGDPVPDPIFDPEPVPIPVPDPVNPDVVPGLPVLPAMPPEMPGFSGVSVLAEIINFTNQSLPTSLIVTFWGIVFGIVILGLIKILHK